MSDRLRKLRQKRLREYSLRDLLTVGLPALTLLVGGFWLAAQFIKPAPPGYLYISSGAPGGSYEVYAERYRQVLARNGVELRDQLLDATEIGWKGERDDLLAGRVSHESRRQLRVRGLVSRLVEKL